MNKGTKQLKKIIGISALIFSIIAAAGYKENYFEISKNLEIYSDIYKTLNIYYVDNTKPARLMKTGVDAMLKSLDPYTTYYPESKIEDYRFTTTGQYGGIGSLIREVEGDIYISEPYEDSPAQKAGLKAGDKIISIDGKTIEDKKQDEVSAILKGQAGTKFNLEVVRNGSEKIKVEIEREEIKIPDVPYQGMLDQNTGYIKLSSFTQTASQEVKKAFKELEKEGMERLVFDLRGNGGGLLREAVNIVNFFVPKGTPVVSTKGKLEEWDREHKALNEPLDLDLPLIILVDGGSASASEIVSGTMQDLDRGVVVGTTTFGKGLVQQTKDAPYGTKLKLTVAKYYTPSGRCIQKLDYYNKSDNGRVEEIPDSLIKKFSTKNGRLVFDSRGVDPDVKVDEEEFGKILEEIIRKDIIFKWVNMYQQEHETIAEASQFALDDTEYDAFVEFARNFDLHYTTGSDIYLEELTEIARTEKYYETIKDQLHTIKDKLDKDQTNDIYKFKDQIKEILENEIVARYYYQKGRAEHALGEDPYVLSALEILNGGEYSRILAGTN